MIHDLLRFTIAALGMMLAPAMTMVLILHFKAWKNVKDCDSYAGLLPLHVATISASYAIITYGLVIGVLANLGSPSNWRLIMYLVGFILGLYSLWIMAKRQRRKISFFREKSIVVSESTTTIQEEQND